MRTVAPLIVLAGIVALSACGNAQPTAPDAPGNASLVAPAAPASPAARPAPIAAQSGGAGVIASCPSVTGTGVPAGARRLGNMTAAGLALSDAAIATIAPADYDPAAGNLQESEADEIDGPVHVAGASFSYAPSLPAVSLVCRYGKTVAPLSGEAMILIPLTPRWAQCRFVAARGGAPASMTCRPSKPVE